MHLRRTVEVLRRCARRIRAWTLAHTEKEAVIILLTLLLAIILRIPLLGHPDRTVFDEVVYTNFALHIIHGDPFFDIHPPLARMLFAEIAKLSGPFTVTAIPVETNQPFGDFPYTALRLFVALFGVLLPLLVYKAGRLLGYLPRIAAIPALFVVFDNAFVVYSRAILPDTILLVFGMAGFIAALAATKELPSQRRWALVLLSGVLLGLAASIKWTALGIVGVVVLLFFFSRMYREIVCSGILVALTYLLVFSSFLLYFPQGGKMDPILSPYNVQWITELEFPNNHSPKTLGAFIVRYHGVMLQANRDPAIAAGTMRAPSPIAWSVAKSTISFWKSDRDGAQIILMGNSLLWFVAFFALIFELLWICFLFIRTRRWPTDNNESVLLAGYLLNYIPFFFIHRPMFLYHYFTALLFLFLLIPRIAPRVIDCIARVSGDRLLARTLATFMALLILLNFFLLSPITYGF